MANLGCWIRKPPRFPSQPVPPTQARELEPPGHLAGLASFDDVSQLASSPPRDMFMRGRDPRDLFFDEGCATFSRRLRFGSCSSSRNPSPTPANSPLRGGLADPAAPWPLAQGQATSAMAPAEQEEDVEPGRMVARDPRGSATRCHSLSPPRDHVPRAGSPLARPTSAKAQAPSPKLASRPVPIPERKGRGHGSRASRECGSDSVAQGGVLLGHRRGLAEPNKGYCTGSDSYSNGYASDGTDFESGSPGTPMFPFEV